MFHLNETHIMMVQTRAVRITHDSKAEYSQKNVILYLVIVSIVITAITILLSLYQSVMEFLRDNAESDITSDSTTS